MIVRRTRRLGPQAQLLPDWRHFAFLTNRTEIITLVEAEHRDHAVVDQFIADLKYQATPKLHRPAATAKCQVLLRASLASHQAAVAPEAGPCG